jgi:broad specificity phosphatase PhoE
MTFLLVRHASVDYDAHPGRFRGHGIDLLPLTDEGVAEARELAMRLSAWGPVDAIVSSPMARALQTAMVLSWGLAMEVSVELDLHEWVPDLSQQWSGGEVPHRAYEELTACGGEWPAGEERLWEPHSRVRERAKGVLHRYADAGDTAVVTHAGVIEALTGATATACCGVVRYELS